VLAEPAVIVGVDASNIRGGGGITHLTNLLASVRPEAHGIEGVIVWGNRDILDRLPERNWLEKIHEPRLDRALPHRLCWQWFRLPALARARCDVLLSPGGNAPPGLAPIVAMSRNMLPFEWRELRRYGLSWMSVRLILLRFGQTRTFERAQGVIFLSRYAQDAVQRVARIRGAVAVVPHGVEERFRKAPRPQRLLRELSREHPLRLLYVSIIDVYKHQCQVAEAVARLREGGLPLLIEFVGPAYPPALQRFRRVLARLDPSERFLRYRGPAPFEKLQTLSDEAELFVFASSCENMPNILLEAMAAGFPIACARRGPMPEMLGDAGVYFDPEDVNSIAAALRALVEDAALRRRCAEAAFARARDYSWERCARETFAFLQQVARSYSRG
jgi:glycosyltransferase involved in cell wall biosynthesis